MNLTDVHSVIAKIFIFLFNVDPDTYNVVEKQIILPILKFALEQPALILQQL